jgi:uncharacterized protein (TIGR03790 family)
MAAEKALDSGAISPAKILLDVCPGYGFEDKSKAPHSLVPAGSGTKVKIIQESKFSEFNSDMVWASEILAARHVPVELEITDRFVGNGTELAGYVSWGSNDRHFEPAVYRSLRFVAGALCETVVSTSARTFLPTKGGQSLIADLIEQGATGAKGYTDEPLLQAVASPSILFERYTRGWTLAEMMIKATDM